MSDYELCPECGGPLDLEDGYCIECDCFPFGECFEDLDYDDEYIYGHMDDVEADADALRSMGWGTDEDYGYNGEEYMNDWEAY